MPQTPSELVLERAALVCDGAEVDSAPGVMLRRGSEVIAAGRPESIGAVPGAKVVERPGQAILPPLGNAHAHLDLSEMEPCPFDGDFPAWLARVRDFRSESDTARATRSFEQGIELCLAGGVALVGDVVGHPLSRDMARVVAMRRGRGLGGVAFLEVFGAGSMCDAALRAIDSLPPDRAAQRAASSGIGTMRDSPAPANGLEVRVGIQPHAPYSTCDRVVEGAFASGRPFSIHLAETGDEVEFTRSGEGPLRSMLESFGVRNFDAPPGMHPVEWLMMREQAAAGQLSLHSASAARLAVHLNEVEPHHAALLASRGFSAVYCPRATAFFGRRGAPWRELREAGVCVALGTDGRLCLDAAHRISTLDEMRWLARNAGASIREVLPMATTAVARALGFDPIAFSLAPGPKPGLLLVPCAGDDPRRAVLEGHDAPSWLVRSEPRS